MTRIIAGTVGGRRIEVPAGGTRPTSERVREAVFSALDAGPGLDGAAVLDLYAGSGALGLEALSRGAAHALFVESDRRAARTLRGNIAALGLGERAGVRTASVEAVVSAAAPRRYDLVIADPPYPVPNAEVTDVLRAAIGNGWLAPDATVVVERPARSRGFEWPPPLRPQRDRRYGDTIVYTGFCYRPGS